MWLTLYYLSYHDRLLKIKFLKLLHLSLTVTKVFGDLPDVSSMVIRQIEEPSQKCDLCKKVMKIFADELDKDDVKFWDAFYTTFLNPDLINLLFLEWFVKSFIPCDKYILICSIFLLRPKF